MPTEKEVSAVLNGIQALEEGSPKIITRDAQKRGHFRQRGWLKWGRLRQMNQGRNNSSATTILDMDDDDIAIEENVIDDHTIKMALPMKTTQTGEEHPSIRSTAEDESRNSIVQTIVDDFMPNKGDQKILRAIGRSATVNAAVLLTAATGGAAAAGGVGFGVGGAITAKRFADGCEQNDEKEVAKSLAVYGAATGASIAGQAITGAVLIGLGAALPVAAAVAFGAGCASGITAGALSEWTVDGVMDKFKRKKDTDHLLQRSRSDGSLLNSHLSPRDTMFKKSKSAAAVVNRSHSSHVKKRSSHKRCQSDGVIVGFHKWSRKRNELCRRHSFSL